MLDEFYEFISKIKKPIGRLKTASVQNFDHGEMPLDNNHDEQQIRPTTIGRKNYLFKKSEVGAKANAMWYRIIQTAKLNKLRVREYLEYLLEAFAWTDQPDWKAYLPWAPEIQERFCITN